MAPLTWREVAAPNFSGASESQRTAGVLLSGGFQSAIDSIGRFGKAQTDRETNALLNEQTQTQTEGYRLDNVNQMTANELASFNLGKTREFEAGRPAAVDLVNQIRTAAALGTPEGRAQAAALQANGSKIFAAAGWSPDAVNSQINGNMATNSSGMAMNQAEQAQADANVSREARLQAEQYFAGAYKDLGGNPEAIADRVRKDPNLDPTVASLVMGEISSKGETLRAPDVDVNMAMIDERLKGPASPAAPLLGLMDSKEGGGRYDTLYGHSQKPGGAFAGTDVTKMTLSQLDSFDEQYGSWVKGEIGRVATPAGRFQIVGTTRRQIAEEMGLAPDTVYTPEVQDAMFQHLVDKRISGPRTLQGKMDGLRQEWEGFKDVSDADLSAAITAYEGGDTSRISGLAGGGQKTPQSQADAAIQNAIRVTGANGPAASSIETAVQRTVDLGNQAQTILNTATANGMLGSEALLTALTAPPSGKSETQIALDTKASLGALADRMNDGDILNKINEVREKFGLSPDMASAIIVNAVEQNNWAKSWFYGQTSIDNGEFEKLVRTVYNPDGKSPSEKLAPAMEKLKFSQVNKSNLETIQSRQAAVVKAQQDWVNAQAQFNSGRKGVKVDAYKIKLDALQAQLDAAIRKTDASPALRSNTFAQR